MDIIVEKKDGRLVPFDGTKIVAAAKKSAERVMVTFTKEQNDWMVENVIKLVTLAGSNPVSVHSLHNYVEMSLASLDPNVEKSYKDYRNYKEKDAALWKRFSSKANSIMYLGSKENANANSQLVSTKRSLILNECNKELYKEFFLTKEEQEAIEDGYIYIHDMSARRDTMNCCLFDVATVIHGGFYMNNQWYNEPKTLDTFGDVCGDLILAAASQQYGGFTVPEIDKLMEPYAEKTYAISIRRYTSYGIDAATADAMALEDVTSQMKGCFQGWEYKFNTVSSSRGDYPFITFTYGLATGRFGKMASILCSETRMNGQGRKGAKKPVLFPKLVFLYDKNLHGENKPLRDVFLAAVRCSQKAMYPDYLSLTGQCNGVDTYGSVPYMYKHFGAVISPMGCRAFLSPWYERGGMYPADEGDKPVYVGRFNIGAVSLHLPMILQKARLEGKDFYNVLDHYLEMIRKLHLRTYDYLGQMKASSNPLAYCEGGFYLGHLKEDDRIEPLLDSATASFGITALNELQELYNGKSLVEDRSFALATMQHINDVVNRYKKEDGRLYAIYGTPAESLCGKQVEQFRMAYGIIPNVSDRPYVSNSFHVHVSEEISPSEKQDIEEEFFDYFLGGRIQYCRYFDNSNTLALVDLIERAMDHGFYEGVNMSLAMCEECGYHGLDMDECPRCHSKNITIMDRICGYLGFTRTGADSMNHRKILSDSTTKDILDTVNTHVSGESRMASHKMSEICDRKCM